MNQKTFAKKIIALLLTVAISISGMLLVPTTAHAAGWLDYVQDMTLGQAVSGSIKDGDFYGRIDSNSGLYYWNVYRFSMPKTGILHAYCESEEKDYFDGSRYRYFTIFSVSDPDNYIWNYKTRDIRQYSAARNMYYGSTEVSLAKGDYYFAIRSPYTLTTPYSLTLSYREPVVNVNSILLDKTTLKMSPGDTRTIKATVLPDNATDKSIYWRSNKRSVATVNNGVVKAVSKGSALITVSSADGEITASCKVTVTDGNTAISNTAAKIKKAQPKSIKISSGKKKLSVRFAPIGMRGVKYQVSYKAKNGKWKTKNIKKTSVTLSKLASKKKYSVRVRGYVKINKKTYYSKWSKIKSLKTK